MKRRTGKKLLSRFTRLMWADFYLNSEVVGNERRRMAIPRDPILHRLLQRLWDKSEPYRNYLDNLRERRQK